MNSADGSSIASSARVDGDAESVLIDTLWDLPLRFRSRPYKPRLQFLELALGEYSGVTESAEAFELVEEVYRRRRASRGRGGRPRSRLVTRSGLAARSGLSNARCNFVDPRRELPGLPNLLPCVGRQPRCDRDARPVDSQDHPAGVAESLSAPGRVNAGGGADDRARLPLILDPSASVQPDRTEGRSEGGNGPLLAGH